AQHEESLPFVARLSHRFISGFLPDRTRAHAGPGLHPLAAAALGRSGCTRTGRGAQGRHSGRDGIVQTANRDSNRAAVLVVAALAILRRIRALGLPAFCDIPVGRRIRANCCLCPLTSFGGNEHGGSPSVSSADQHHVEPARPILLTVRDTIALRLASSSHYLGLHLCAALG